MAEKKKNYDIFPPVLNMQIPKRKAEGVLKSIFLNRNTSAVGLIRSGIPDLVRIWTKVPKMVRNRSEIGH